MCFEQTLAWIFMRAALLGSIQFYLAIFVFVNRKAIRKYQQSWDRRFRMLFCCMSEGADGVSGLVFVSVFHFFTQQCCCFLRPFVLLAAKLVANHVSTSQREYQYGRFSGLLHLS